MTILSTVLTTPPSAIPVSALLSSVGNSLNQFFMAIKLLIDVFGSVAILVGAVLGAIRYVLYRFFEVKKYSMDSIRLDLARAIILGLEFFVAGDIIQMTIAPDFSSLGILGLLVIIRSFLNYSLQKEVQKLSTPISAQQ